MRFWKFPRGLVGDERSNQRVGRYVPISQQKARGLGVSGTQDSESRVDVWQAGSTVDWSRRKKLTFDAARPSR